MKKKIIYISILFNSILLFASIPNSKHKDEPIYLDDNGITIKAREWAKVGDASIINGKSYVVANKQMILTAYSLNEDLSLLCTTKVTNMQSLFRKKNLIANRRQNINNWDVSNVTNMSRMFESAYYYGELNAWDVSNVEDMSYMFEDYGEGINVDVSSWDVSNVKNMYRMFYRNNYFNQDLSNWDVSNVTNMGAMFFYAINFNSNIGSWDVRNVTDMNGMFRNAKEFNQDLSNWNISNVLNMNSLFSYTNLSTENYDKILNSWSKLSVKNNVILGAIGIKYCNSEISRNLLIDNYNWLITDDGKDCSSLGVDKEEIEKIIVYPNPTSDYLFINNLEELLKFKIIDSNGKTIIEDKNKAKIDLRNLSKGIYFIILFNKTKIINYKFIKN